MHFNDLPVQIPINPKADAYGAECLRLSRLAAATRRCVLDVPYGASEWQRLDLYLPDDPALRQLPVLVFMHGGGWTHGYKEWCGFMAAAVNDFPAILASVSYRLLPDVAYPVPVDDCVAALKWVYDHVEAQGGDAGRLYVGGHSAGGQIAALMALQPDRLLAAGLPADAIKAVFCLSATFNRRMVNPVAAPAHVPPEPHTAIAAGSPLALAESARTPFFIAWGGNEDERLERTGRQMEAALGRVGCPVEVLVAPDRDHFEVHLDTRHADNAWTRRVRAWMTAPALPPA